MVAIKGRIAHTSGIPLGGLGTGSVEIRPDGYFHEWQIFNLGWWAPQQPDCCKDRSLWPELPPHALSFFVRAQVNGRRPLLRRLGVRSDVHNLYSFPWLKSVQRIDFEGRFPVARLRYVDRELPVELSATMFSPFTPHDARRSGTPGFYVAFRARNRTSQEVKLSLLATLMNPLAWGASERALENAVSHEGDSAIISMKTSAEMDCKATIGSMAISVSGGQPSWIAGEYPDFINGYLIWDTPYGVSHESAFYGFRETGMLPSLGGTTSPSKLLRMGDSELDSLSRAEKEKIVTQLRRYAIFDAVWRRVEHVEPDLLRTDEGLTTFLKDARTRLDHLAGKDRSKQSWGDCALCSKVSLAPGEEKEIVFALSWYFPYHYSALGPVIGHMYENWFKDAEDVNRFLISNYAEHRRKTLLFADTLFDTTLPIELVEAVSAQLTTLPKCTWWTKKGEFAVWEGLGCCGFHTTDITYQGSFGILALFPELQKSQMEMGARFQRQDGRVHHFFTPDFSRVDEGFDRVDMNQQFVLLVCRDYLWTGDKDYIRRLWPNIVKAMDNTALLDADGDGLPDHDTKRNTYDCWNFFGTPSYIASLWLAALRAAVRIAHDLGEKDREKSWGETLAKGVESFERKLWNGEYYSLWVDGSRRDECCMTDQIDGEWFTNLIGLGHSLPKERILAALKAIMKYNFSREDGLINASYPPSAKPVLSTYANLQAMAPWTGIEYAMASMMLDFGMVAEGLAVVKNIHERYMRAGRFWNHVECGDHYYRAMSSWALLAASTGFKIDVPAGRLELVPRVKLAETISPWVSSTGWGRFRRTASRLELECTSGELGFKELVLDLVSQGLDVTLNGRRLSAKVSPSGELCTIAFDKPVLLGSGDRLVVSPAGA